MSNFQIFDNSHLAKLIDPFVPGMKNHITPIKYEALTPDIFIFLFKTTSKTNQSHYFISLEADHLQSLQSAGETIEDWAKSKVRSFLKPGGNELSGMDGLKVDTSGPYFALLAEIDRPMASDYWAKCIHILPGDNIMDKLNVYDEPTRKMAFDNVQDILASKPSSESSFLDSFNGKERQINDTNLAISVYYNKDDCLEFFYS